MINPEVSELDSGSVCEPSMLNFTLRGDDGKTYFMNSISCLGDRYS